MPRSRLGRQLALTIVWLFVRPPRLSDFALKQVLRRAARRLALPFALVPVGLVLAALMERHADHPLVRRLRAYFDADDPAESPPPPSS